jgi:hypothetical protein
MMVNADTELYGDNTWMATPQSRSHNSAMWPRWLAYCEEQRMSTYYEVGKGLQLIDEGATKT